MRLRVYLQPPDGFSNQSSSYESILLRDVSEDEADDLLEAFENQRSKDSRFFASTTSDRKFGFLLSAVAAIVEESEM